MLHTCRFCVCSSVWKRNIITLAADNPLAFSSAPATQMFPIPLTTVVLSPDVFHFPQCLVNSCRIGCDACQLCHHHIPINIFTGAGSLLDTLQYSREWSVYPARQKLHISAAEQKKSIPEGKKKIRVSLCLIWEMVTRLHTCVFNLATRPIQGCQNPEMHNMPKQYQSTTYASSCEVLVHTAIAKMTRWVFHHELLLVPLFLNLLWIFNGSQGQL